MRLIFSRDILWDCLFRKEIDKTRINHGVYWHARRNDDERQEFWYLILEEKMGNEIQHPVFLEY